MKKIVLFIMSVMAFTGISVAQDVYTAGFNYNEVSTENSTVFKNGELLYSQGDDPSFYHISYDVLCLDGNVYWVDYYYNTNTGEEHGNVYKNANPYLVNEDGTCVYALFTDGTDVYAAGYKIVNTVKTPAVWKGSSSTPFILFDTGGNEGEIEKALIVDGIVYACGQKFNGNGYEGVVWDSDNGELFNFGERNYADDITVYNGSVYTIVNQRSDDWKASVYCDSYEFYELTDYGGAYALSMDAGDLYIYGDDHNVHTVWKNDQVLYSHPELNDYPVDIVSNSQGVYYLTSHSTYKDGHGQYVCKYNSAMFVDVDCKNYTARNLPYYESFETGTTDWECWAQMDFDHQNGGYASYWQRIGQDGAVSPASDQYCAMHRFNSNYNQDGWLTTPLISIPAGGSVTMTFKTYERYSSDYGYEGVWVIEGGHKASAEVWTQTEPSDEWKTVTIDLSAYQGNDVEIDFRYSGANAHSWYIDDIMIVSDYQPCPPVIAPYVEHFDTGLGECMYVLDADHDGTCWLWNAMYQAAIHPRGVNNSQEGGLCTPRIALSADKSYQLKFDFRTILPKGESWKTVEYSVWMVVDGNGLNNLEDFNEIWRKNFITETNEFETVTIDLAPYSGHTVQFAFSYEGFEAFMWLLDNIEVVEKTGVDENGSNGLAVYPNPASDRIRIEGLEADSEVQIYNAIGELVKTVKAEANGEINIVELAKGLYLVRCGAATMRFVKE